MSWIAEHRGILQGTAAGLGALVLLSWSTPTAAVVLIVVALIAAIAGAPGRASRP